jgi:acetyl-CoA C-acetyltransferase
MPEHAYIVGAARTPIGSFQGALSSVTAPMLGAIAIRAAVDGAGVDPQTVTEVLMGNVIAAGLKQAPARQAARGAGLPDGCGATTINKVCGSGMKATMLASDLIRAGSAGWSLPAAWKA